MSRLVTSVLRSLDRTMQGLESEQWAIIAIALVVLGFFCMRGFGSQKSY